MKLLLTLLQKEFRLIARDRRSLLFVVGIPVILVLLFGFAISTDVREARIGIVDPARDDWTRSLTHRLLESEYFELEQMYGSLDEVRQAFRQGRIKMALVYAPQQVARLDRGTGAQLQLLADATEPNTATTLVQYASAIIARHEQERGHRAGVQLPAYLHTHMLYNPGLKSVYMFVPGIMTVILMLICAMMTSISIVREKEQGQMEWLLASPLNARLIILGKILPYITIGLGLAALVLSMGVLVFGVPVQGNWGLLVVESLLFVLTALGLGILISTRVQSQQVALLISLMALMLPTILLSGFIFPIDSMPVILQWISHIIPAKWFLVILKGIMLKGVGLDVLWRESLILAAMAAFLLLASVRNFKDRLAA